MKTNLATFKSILTFFGTGVAFLYFHRFFVHSHGNHRLQYKMLVCVIEKRSLLCAWEVLPVTYSQQAASLGRRTQRERLPSPGTAAFFVLSVCSASVFS